MTFKKKRAYSLPELQELLRSSETWAITKIARETAASIGFADDDDIAKKMLELTWKNFCWSLESKHDPSLQQDVYKLPHDDITIYIKLQLGHDGRCYVISFKEDTAEEYWNV